jgi:hypothetical protein
VHDEFLCHVTAYGAAGGQRIGVPLGTYRAPTLPLALWWLRDRATWIAERLDPTPECPYFPAQALSLIGAHVPDVPDLLRGWRDDPACQNRVAEQLAAGLLIRVAVHDEVTEYELLAESVDALRMHRAVPRMTTPPPGRRRAAAAGPRLRQPTPFG